MSRVVTPNTSGPATGRRIWLGLGVAVGLLALSAPAWRALKERRRGSGIDLHAAPRPLPALQFADGAGRALALDDFRGRVVLLNVWATWCAPCREEMQTLDHLQGLLGGPDFEVLALSVDQPGLPVVQPFFDRVGIKHLRPYLDPAGAALSALAVPGVPLTLLIDRDGNEVGRKLGPAAWDDATMVELIRGRIEATRRASAFHATAIAGVERGRDFHLTADHGRPRRPQDFASTTHLRRRILLPTTRRGL